jgi:urease accessory protein
MICEHILGNCKKLTLDGKKVEFVEIEWEEAFKRIHKKVTDCGREVGIRLDDSVLTTGMAEGDVIYLDDTLAIVIKIKACQVILIQVAADHRFMVAKVCYEIGNRHAPLFYGANQCQFITPYNEPMFQMLSSFHGVSVKETMSKLDFNKKISNTIHKHQH